MKQRCLIAIALVAAGCMMAQTPASSKVSKPAWHAPRTADGQPDLEGVWDTASITPLERPVALGTKAYYTKEEAAAYEKTRHVDLNRDRRDGNADADLARAYNDSWFDRGAHLGATLRTSRVIDPSNGRFPNLLPAAKKKYDEFHAWFAANPADSAQDRTLYDRCLVFSQTGPPLIPGNYNNMYQIVQTADTVTIFSEMGHQARVVPLTRQPALAAPVTQWVGDSRGHWEGDTLVIETANLRSNQQSRFGVQYEGMSDENLRVTERFTRASPTLVIYQATVTDPTVYTQPWTIELPMAKSNEAIFEYACHEGNYGLAGILSGERAKEKASPIK